MQQNDLSSRCWCDAFTRSAVYFQEILYVCSETTLHSLPRCISMHFVASELVFLM